MFNRKIGRDENLSNISLPSWNMNDAVSMYSDICQALQHVSFDKNDIKIVISGNPVPNEIVTNYNGVLNNTKIIDLYSRGATIVLHGAERFSYLMKEALVSNFSSMQGNCHANIYLTPSTSLGVGYHLDDHDVIIFQLCGSKCWYYRDEFKQEKRFYTSPGGWYFLGNNIEHTTETKGDFSMHLTIGLSSKKEISLHEKTIASESPFSIIKSLNSIDVDTRMEHSTLTSEDISRSIDLYASSLSLRNESSSVFEFIRKSTPGDLFKFIDSEDVSSSSRVKFLKILVKSQIIDINRDERFT